MSTVFFRRALATTNCKYTMCVVFFIKKTVFFVSATIFLTQCQKLGWDFLKIFLNFYLCIFFNANNNTNKNTLNNNNKRQFLTYFLKVLTFWGSFSYKNYSYKRRTCIWQICLFKVRCYFQEALAVIHLSGTVIILGRHLQSSSLLCFFETNACSHPFFQS